MIIFPQLARWTDGTPSHHVFAPLRTGDRIHSRLSPMNFAELRNPRGRRLLITENRVFIEWIFVGFGFAMNWKRIIHFGISSDIGDSFLVVEFMTKFCRSINDNY